MTSSTAAERRGNEALRPLDASVPGGKRATRLSFFIAGFALSSWAPLVPYAAKRMAADSATLGSILLCLGLGAVIGMPVASAFATRVGTRVVIIFGAVSLVVTLPMLAFVSTPMLMGGILLWFGCAIGATDVAANIHGTEVEHAANAPLMSGFHGMYSVGGLLGATGVTALIAVGINEVVAATLASLVIAVSISVAVSGFFKNRPVGEHPLFVMPRGPVLVIGLLAALIFLAEGAMLDWGALLLTQAKSVEVSLSGAGYSVFATAMLFSRLIGDRLVRRYGERPMLVGGTVLTGVGLLIFAVVSSVPIAFFGITLAGLAVGNLVPVLFSLAGRQKVMAPSHAIAAASILGYSGVLLGPALIGYAAHFIGLQASFVSLAAIVLVATILMATVAPRRGAA
ncbi:MFS transporter [Stenotrophomonas sp.]|uniref:MFS transporter n=1 Tax=Stenotrophomonas sp. TaxID=69392 RepID=UPI00289F6C6F|nr:MFS transporter [Stenotrophomonas sp.]